MQCWTTASGTVCPMIAVYIHSHVQNDTATARMTERWGAHCWRSEGDDADHRQGVLHRGPDATGLRARSAIAIPGAHHTTWHLQHAASIVLWLLQAYNLFGM